MANLHKADWKLPWWVRDGELLSDWLGAGRSGGKFCRHTKSDLCGMPDPAVLSLPKQGLGLGLCRDESITLHKVKIGLRFSVKSNVPIPVFCFFLVRTI